MKQAEAKVAKETAKEVAKATAQERKAAGGAATALKKPAVAKPIDEEDDEEDEVDFDKITKVATPPAKKKQKKGIGNSKMSTPEAEKLPPIPASVFGVFMDV